MEYGTEHHTHNLAFVMLYHLTQGTIKLQYRYPLFTYSHEKNSWQQVNNRKETGRQHEYCDTT